MSKNVIASPDAPAALGPYSQAIRAGYTVYLSGQLGLDPKTGTLVDGIEAQTHQVFRNLRAVAIAAGGSLDDMVKLSILMQNLGDFAKVNEISTNRSSVGPNATYDSLSSLSTFADRNAWIASSR